MVWGGLDILAAEDMDFNHAVPLDTCDYEDRGPKTGTVPYSAEIPEASKK